MSAASSIAGSILDMAKSVPRAAGMQPVNMRRPPRTGTSGRRPGSHPVFFVGPRRRRPPRRAPRPSLLRHLLAREPCESLRSASGAGATGLEPATSGVTGRRFPSEKPCKSGGRELRAPCPRHLFACRSRAQRAAWSPTMTGGGLSRPAQTDYRTLAQVSRLASRWAERFRTMIMSSVATSRSPLWFVRAVHRAAAARPGERVDGLQRRSRRPAGGRDDPLPRDRGHRLRDRGRSPPDADDARAARVTAWPHAAPGRSRQAGAEAVAGQDHDHAPAAHAHDQGDRARQRVGDREPEGQRRLALARKPRGIAATRRRACPSSADEAIGGRHSPATDRVGTLTNRECVRSWTPPVLSTRALEERPGSRYSMGLWQ